MNKCYRMVCICTYVNWTHHCIVYTVYTVQAGRKRKRKRQCAIQLWTIYIQLFIHANKPFCFKIILNLFLYISESAGEPGADRVRLRPYRLLQSHWSRRSRLQPSRPGGQTLARNDRKPAPASHSLAHTTGAPCSSRSRQHVGPSSCVCHLYRLFFRLSTDDNRLLEHGGRSAVCQWAIAYLKDGTISCASMDWSVTPSFTHQSYRVDRSAV